MRGFFSRRIPHFRRLILVESGSRELFETLLPALYKTHGDQLSIDLVTCYGGVPGAFRSDRGAVYRISDYIGAPARKRLYAELASNRYDIMGIICSGEPIMTRWKWALAWHVPSKLFVLNENGDYFFVDRGNLDIIQHFIAFRSGMSGENLVPTLARLPLFPFAVLYLVLYAATMHLRRKLRTI